MGHKRKAGKREPNGRLSRKTADVSERYRDGLDKEERDTISTGLSARVRVHGVKPEHSRDQLAGSFVGRLCLTGELSRVQYDAAMSYMEDWHANLRAIQAAIPPWPNAIDLNATKGRAVGPENIARAQRSVQAWRAARAAVQERQNELRGAGNLFGALDHCVLRDHDHPHLVGSLREALNALARFYRLLSTEAA